MAILVDMMMKVLVASFLVIVIVQVSMDVGSVGNLRFFGLHTAGVYRRLQPAIECKAACEERCKLNERHNLCTRACGTCCDRCKCVPPGQNGNRQLCGACYANMTTHNNRTKCP